MKSPKEKYFLLFVAVFVGLIAIWFYKNKSIGVPKLPLTQRITGKTLTSLEKVTDQNFEHIAVIVMENKSFKDIVGNKSARYINSLINKYGLLANYHAVTRPSLPNYIALIGGSTFEINSNCADCFLSGDNLTDQLEKYHKTWKAYMESMPSACFLGSRGLYAQKHNPFIYFNNVRNDKKRCSNIVPYSELEKDLKSSPPNFIFISPNLCNDMHDCPVSTGDKWLSREIPMILNSPTFINQNSLLILTWDEDDGSVGNKVVTVLVGDGIKSGFVSQVYYTHYSLLHTIESLWNMPPLTKNVSQSAVISDVF